MASDTDDLEEFIAECTKEDPDFPTMVEAALQRRQAARARGEDPNDVPLAEEAEEGQPTTPNAQV